MKDYKNLTFENIEKNNLLLYRYIRGSQCQGTATEKSDIDEGGVYICPPEQLLDLGYNYQEQISNNTNDIVWYEFNKYIKLLLSSNPTILESLFIDDKFVIYEHPIITELKKHKYEFITKQCFKSFIGYSYSQINKAQGLNKKIVNPINERKNILDFCYTFYNQGSTKILNWLNYRGLKQQYCGVVNIPNMHNMFSIFYDWGNFFINENISLSDIKNSLNNENNIKDIIFNLKNKSIDITTSIEYKNAQLYNLYNFIIKIYNINNIEDWYNKQIPLGYKGITNLHETSNDIRLSSVLKGSIPICYMSYNKDGFIKHCKDYKEYKDWEKNRNPERFKINIEHNKNYDSKNLSHAVRLLHTGIEIAKTGKYIVNRENIDRDLLLEIKRGEKSYDELISYIKSKKNEMEQAMKNSSLPDNIDINKINDLVLTIRKKQLNIL